ncbi:MAG: hypothetical protein ACLFNC_05170 [Halodesulfurarchaeum sp.]
MVGGGKNRAGARFIETDTSEKAKRVKATLSGELLVTAHADRE